MADASDDVNGDPAAGLRNSKSPQKTYVRTGAGGLRSCARGREVIWPGVRKTAVGQSESTDRDKSKSHGHCRSDRQARPNKKKKVVSEKRSKGEIGLQGHPTGCRTRNGGKVSNS